MHSVVEKKTNDPYNYNLRTLDVKKKYDVKSDLDNQ